MKREEVRDRVPYLHAPRGISQSCFSFPSLLLLLSPRVHIFPQRYLTVIMRENITPFTTMTKRVPGFLG